MNVLNTEIVKHVAGILATVITFVAFIPYIISILKDKIKPHTFSWIIWGITTCIVCIAQWKEKGGFGAFPTGVSAFITIWIAILSYYKKADDTITRSDYFFLILALSSLPVWYVTSNPFWAVLILTLVDLIGFIPTFRKAYVKPYEESTLFYLWFIIRNALSIVALENQNLTTVLFPIMVAIGCILLVILIEVRKRQLKINH